MLVSKDAALLLIGYQNDYFSKDGVLQPVVDESLHTNQVLANTISLIEKHVNNFGLIIATPIVFTENYKELDKPIGILKVCQDLGAFQSNSSGSDIISDFDEWSNDITIVPGKTGLNAFSNTDVERLLKGKGIKRVVIAGVVTSACIDSSARSASEKGFEVIVLSDCTAGRNNFEQEFYCNDIFPMFAHVKSSKELHIAD
ncbi:MAG: isochorismatase [Cellvibrionales bacterium]|nr:isochorismatase [Cellvibrionales bacterium]